MINKRLLAYARNSKKYVYLQVACQIGALIAQIIMIMVLATLVQNVFLGVHMLLSTWISYIGILAICLIFRYTLNELASNYSYYAATNIKANLRAEIFEKLLLVKDDYKKQVSTSEITQLASEGIDQLDIYFSKYVPQFIYSMIAPVILFIVLLPIDFGAAIVLLVGVPLIPISIIAVQKFAKKLLGKYWGIYTSLGDGFLDNVRGLSTLKSMNADEAMNKKMNEDAESFRKVTMKVLIMQLNSISVMDLVAFGGAALGMLIAILHFRNGTITIGQMFILIMLSAEFFIPMRLLGSYFHIAMNGNAASNKIFDFLDEEFEDTASIDIPARAQALTIKDLSFSYDDVNNTLKNIDLETKDTGLYAFVGESGCGKSTLMKCINGNLNYEGSLCFGDSEVRDITASSRYDFMTLIKDQNYIFKGSVRNTLLEGKPTASDAEMLDALELVSLKAFVESEGGLDMMLDENASNISGGQKQRLALARALLHDTPVYIFDEATSNIDVDSEKAIMKVISKLAKEKLVLMVTHRLANAIPATSVIAIKDGEIIGNAPHKKLVEENEFYKTMFETQMRVENFGGDNNE